MNIKEEKSRMKKINDLVTKYLDDIATYKKIKIEEMLEKLTEINKEFGGWWKMWQKMLL